MLRYLTLVVCFFFTLSPATAWSFNTCVNDKGQMMISDRPCVAPYRDKNRTTDVREEEPVKDEKGLTQMERYQQQKERSKTEREKMWEEQKVKDEERQRKYEETMENRRIQQSIQQGEYQEQRSSGNQDQPVVTFQKGTSMKDKLQRTLNNRDGQWDGYMKSISEPPHSILKRPTKHD